MIFSSSLLKIWSFQKVPRRHTIFLVLSGKMAFFPENMIFFPWAESERRPFSGNTWKHDASPSEKKQETWYIGSKFGLSLNLFGWRYSTMNNLQYFVPFSPQELCLGACLSANKANHCQGKLRIKYPAWVSHNTEKKAVMFNSSSTSLSF